MIFPFYIARRYFFSKKSHNAINVISLISVCGVVVATTALVCALSVMNGFNAVIFSMFGSLDSELKITPAHGKVFDSTSEEIQKLRTLPGIALMSDVLQDNALIRYQDRQVIGTIKGVDDNYRSLTSIDSALIDGEFTLKDEVADYAVPGIGTANDLGINAGFVAPLEIYAPKRNGQVNLSNPSTSFNVEYTYITAVFRTGQQAYDEAFMIVPLSLTRRVFDYENEISAIELKLTGEYSLPAMKKRIQALLGSNYIVSDRYEQQADSYRMMQSEKWMIFLILCFILVIALFNMVSSLSMLMIEKQDDVRTLRTMGADDSLIRRIFLFEGWMISGAGALIGVCAGLALCFLQQKFGLIKMGVAGTFVIDNYPVQVEFPDICIILITVMSIGFLSAWYPVYRIGDRWIKKA
ncbi:MAG: FtsX-like permease family protein [Tannerellaceae bacterium]|jgi:ABC-type lipoprotein release transport system permease subunit|nr:FtsX-like permease family protein [Tannerellaceae bacterium]